jgi:hypothetical protein
MKHRENRNQNRPARRNGVRRFAGSPFTNEESTTPAQEPLIPLHQLQPSHAEIVKAEDVLRPRRVVRNGKSKPAPKAFVKSRTARQRYRLSRRDVVAILNKPSVTESLPASLCSQYRALAAGNTTVQELAVKHHLSTIAMEAIVEGWESDIVAKACVIYPKFRPYGSDPENGRDIGEKSENEDEIAQDNDIAKTGGGAIGGRVISRGSKATPGKTLQNEKLDTFERSGRITVTSSSPGRDRSGSQVSEEDNYSENSGDDIPRSD